MSSLSHGAAHCIHAGVTWKNDTVKKRESLESFCDLGSQMSLVFYQTVKTNLGFPDGAHMTFILPAM